MGTRTISQTINLQTPDQSSKYISADSSGLMVYDGREGAQTPSSPSSTTNNVFIDENSLDIRRGTDVLATFGVSEAIIGQTDSGNLLADTNGIAVRDGLTELATFGANGAVIGRSSSYHLDTTANGTFIKKGTTSILDITAETVSNTKYSYIDSSSNYAFADTSLSVDTTSSGDANAGFLVDGSSSGSGAYASIDAHRTRTKGSVTIEVSDNGEDTTTVDVKNNGIYVNNHSSPIGTVKYAQLTSNKSVPNNTGTMLTSISLEAGVWVIVCGVRWATNNNGYRRMNLATVSGATDIQYVVHPVQGEWTQAIFTRILEVESTTTYYLNAYQNSGSAINAIGAAGTNYGTYITAVRII